MKPLAFTTLGFVWKRLLLAAWVLVVLLTGRLAQAQVQPQVPRWQSALSFNASTHEIATDARGNVFLTGFFQGVVQLGNITLTSQTEAPDLFVAKWSPETNNFVWAQRAGGDLAERGMAVAVSGNAVYVFGNFMSPTIAFGTTVLANSNSSQPGSFSPDMFVARLTDKGASASFDWAVSAGGAGFDYAADLVVSGTNVYIAGYFEGSTARFGTETLTNINVPGQTSAEVSSDAFLAKLTDGGSSASFTWAYRIGGLGDEVAYGLATNGANLYVAGAFDSPGVRYGCTLCLTQLHSAGGQDVFVGKLTDVGPGAAFGWVQGIGSTGDEVATGIAVQQNNLYVTGYFSSTTLNFGSTALTNGGDTDVFVAKLVDDNATSAFAWAERGGGRDGDFPTDIAANGASVYVTGKYNSNAVGFGSTLLPNLGVSADIFVAKLNDAGSRGSFVWAERAGGASVDEASTVAVHATRIYVSGYVSGPASFGNVQVDGPPGFLAWLQDVALASVSSVRLEGVSLYPNPAHMSVELMVPSAPGATRATLALSDGLGRTIRSFSLAVPAGGLRYQMPVEDLAPGIYNLRVQAGKYSALRRLVIE